MNEPCYLLPESVRQALAQYLVNRPWHEVDALLRALMALKPAPRPNQSDTESLAANGYVDA